MKGIVVVDIERCQACKSCEFACALEHSQAKTIYEAIGEKPRPRSRVKLGGAGKLSVPLRCRHCQDAPCVEICPTGAVTRAGEGEPVIIDTSKCVGCHFCVLACRYGVLGVDESGKVLIRCDLCAERLKQGEEPACVVACPTGGLRFLREDEIPAELKKEKGEYLVIFRKGKQKLEV